MITIENDCVDCGLPCLGSGCPYRNVSHYYCDSCGNEAELYKYDDEQLCIDCIKERLVEVV